MPTNVRSLAPPFRNLSRTSNSSLWRLRPRRAPKWWSLPIDLFWELVNETVNAVLFVLIGLEVLALTFTEKNLVAGLLAIPIVLAARLISVGLPIRVLRRWVWFEPFTVHILTWGGLRGGIWVALALSVPKESPGVAVPGRNVILAVTYVVVVFSIVVQGLTIGPLTRRWLAGSREPIS